jgi:caa(3)-type oxidase subunit IV
MRQLVLTWLALVVLLALEIGASLLPLRPTARPLILVPAIAMLGVILAGFMEVRRAPMLARLFLAAGLLWLVILLALGSLDPLTRVNYLVGQ